MKIKLHFSEYENDLKVRPTLDEIKEQLATAISLGDDLTPTEVAEEAPVKLIYEFFDQFVKEESVLNQWAAATLKNWHTFKIHLESFGKRLEFRDFNEKGLSRFIMHLRKVCKMEEKTVQEAGALAKTRDLFCFCAFTSLRYSDMAALKRTDIDGDKIYITTQKTNDRLPIDLSKNAKAILEKYKDEQFPFGLALPVISNQKMNHYLKDLGELCGFTTPITIVCYRAGQRVEETYPKYSLIGTHAARRTFICFALSNGVPPQVVMKWTGHSDYKAMRPYIDIAEKTKADAMKLIDNAWGM